MMKPTPPIAIVPRRHIFIESQSSVLPGFVASLYNLEADLRNDLSPKVPRTFQKSFLICKGNFRDNQIADLSTFVSPCASYKEHSPVLKCFVAEYSLKGMYVAKRSFDLCEWFHSSIDKNQYGKEGKLSQVRRTSYFFAR